MSQPLVHLEGKGTSFRRSLWRRARPKAFKRSTRPSHVEPGPTGREKLDWVERDSIQLVLDKLSESLVYVFRFHCRDELFIEPSVDPFSRQLERHVVVRLVET